MPSNFVRFLRAVRMAVDAVKEKALADYRAKLLEHREVDARLNPGSAKASDWNPDIANCIVLEPELEVQKVRSSVY